ncbi:MAG: hypothetical protein AAFN67_05955, partial [Pseudomonadota bacterium]
QIRPAVTCIPCSPTNEKNAVRNALCCGLIWMTIMFIEVTRRGLGEQTVTRLSCLSLFWHFLDIVWICVFTVVYLMGAM